MDASDLLRVVGRTMLGLSIVDGVGRGRLRTYHAIGLVLFVIGELANDRK